MQHKNIMSWIERKLGVLSVPEANCQLRRVPSHVECAIAIGSFHRVLRFRSGASEADLEREFRAVAEFLAKHRGVKHLEEAIGEAT